MDQIAYAYLGKAVAAVLAWGGSVALATWAAVRFVPQQWLQHRFDAQLEQQRSDYAREREEMRHQFEVLQMRLSKLHEKEFDVLADAWEKLNEALGHLASLVASLQQYPNFDRMDQVRFEASVGKGVLEDEDKSELLALPPGKRNRFYSDRIFWYRLRDAKRASRELNRVIRRNSIFLEPQIRERFVTIEAAVYKALVSREVGEEAGDHKLWREAQEQLTSEIEPLMKEIEKLVQTRLGY